MKNASLISVAILMSASAASAQIIHPRMPAFTEPVIEAQSRLHEPQRVMAVLAPKWQLTCKHTTDNCTKLVNATEMAIARAQNAGKASKIGLTPKMEQVISGEYWQIQVTGNVAVRDSVEKYLIKAGFVLRSKPK